MLIPLTQPINLALLDEEIAAHFPAWIEYAADGSLIRRDFAVQENPLGYAPGYYLLVPDDADLAAVEAVIAAHVSTNDDAQARFRKQILNLAQTAVGVRLQDLTAAQIKALMACLLYQAGGVVKNTLVVRPLSDWM